MHDVFDTADVLINSVVILRDIGLAVARFIREFRVVVVMTVVKSNAVPVFREINSGCFLLGCRCIGITTNL